VKGEAKDRRITKMLGKGYLEGEQVPTLLKDLISDLEAGPRIKQISQKRSV